MFSVKSIEEALGITLAISPEERREQENWRNIINGDADWNDDKIISNMTASTSCKEVAIAATTAFESSIGGSVLADYVNSQYQRVTDRIYDIAYDICANGRIILKPFVYNNEIHVRIVENYAYFPFAYDAIGNLIGVVFTDTTSDNDTYYTLLEMCYFENNTYTVEYSAWRSKNEDQLGTQVSLSTIPDWASLPDEPIPWPNVKRPWFVEVTLKNNRPIFADGINLIKEIDEQFEIIRHESKQGRSRIFADYSLFLRDADNNPIGVEADAFQVLRKSGTSDDKPLLETHSPTLRIDDLNNGLNILFRQYETMIGLSRAAFSDPNQQNVTATEVESQKPRFADTVDNLQKKVLEPALIELVKIIADMAIPNRYSLAPMGYIEPEEIYFFWDKTYLVTKKEVDEANAKMFATLMQATSLGLKREVPIAFLYNTSDTLSKLTDEDINKARALMGSVFEPLDE